MIEIYNIESIDELSVYLSKQEQVKARNWLFSQFDKLYHYANIKEWNELVRVCEALKIIGWGDKEPLEAKAQRWINGSFYTSLMNQYFEIKIPMFWKMVVIKPIMLVINFSRNEIYCPNHLFGGRSQGTIKNQFNRSMKVLID